MTTAEDSTALVARGIATAEHLGHITIAFADPADLDGPACVDRKNGILWVRRGLPLEEVMLLAHSCLDVIAGGTIVQTEDGELEVLPDIAVGAEGLVLTEPPRRHLRIVP